MPGTAITLNLQSRSTGESKVDLPSKYICTLTHRQVALTEIVARKPDFDHNGNLHVSESSGIAIAIDEIRVIYKVHHLHCTLYSFLRSTGYSFCTTKRGMFT